MRGAPDAAAPGTRAHLGILLPDLSGGGAERVGVVLANAAAQRGAKASLVLLRADGALRDSVDPRVDVVELRAASTRASLRPLRHWLRAARPDALMVTPSHLGWAACVAGVGLLPQQRIFIREASTLSVDLAMMPPGARLARLFAERVLSRRARRIALCGACADDLAGTVGAARAAIAVVPNPVISDEDIRAPLASARPGAPVVFAAGRLVYQKGFDTLLRAFALLRRSREASLVIAGDGPDRVALAALARSLGCEDATTFQGFVPRLAQDMRDAAAFVLPSRWEGLPGVLIEALAAGTPVVATDCPGGSREILEEGRWGQLVPVDDAQAMAAALERALDAPRRRPDAAWLRRYSVEAAVSGYLSAMGLDPT